MAMVSGFVKAVQGNRIALLVPPLPEEGAEVGAEEGAEGAVEVGRKKSAPKKKSAKKVEPEKVEPEKVELGKEEADLEEAREEGLKAREAEAAADAEIGDLHYYMLDMLVKVTVNGMPYTADHLMEGDAVDCLFRDERSNSIVRITAIRDEPFGDQAPAPEPPPGEEGGELPERPEEPIRPGGPPIAVPDSPEKVPDFPEPAPDLPTERDDGLIDVEVELEEDAEEEEEAGPDKPAGSRRKTKRKR